MPYTEEYKSPHWQKRRLLVLQRDEWTCRGCGDTESTLHVHHRYYEKGKKIWDYPLEALVTLCEECHQEETELMPIAISTLLSAFRSHFLASEIDDIACSVGTMVLCDKSSVVATAFSWAFGYPQAQKEVVRRRSEFLKAKRQKRSKTKK